MPCRAALMVACWRSASTAAHLRTSLVRAAALLPAATMGQLAAAAVTRSLAVWHGRGALADSSLPQSTCLLAQSVIMSCCAGAWAVTVALQATAGALTLLASTTARGPHLLQHQPEAR